MPLPSRRVLKRTAAVSIIAAIVSISISTGIRFVLGVHSDTITIVVRLVLPFLIAIPIALIWFSKLERLETAYRVLMRRANELARTASTDPLTGVLNRRSFIEQFERAMELGVRGWFLLADIDYLKMINDNFGHLAGDEAVISAARALEAVLPDDSLLARIGGDEFCAFVPGVSQDNMLAFSKHISETAGTNFKEAVQTDGAALSVSIGNIVCKPKQTFKDVIRQADERLYRKKKVAHSSSRIIIPNGQIVARLIFIGI
ncbi:GGDEF domain-containing protein [Brucella pecoris]|uniref:diguanylate cyclase n=1 Tax=Brucella pecoris TaxID=867683 RepID=A0A5C5CMK9_9HYPH|nr:GGDEF domain-containing protein [Brucella pecoris]MBB4093974.1 diguanylate cyclase (GGDEF)-like protein [Brucella pecoris]TNV12660.1 GGDEF domain-containing protein [Brucella pecoris]